jgi:hypothetical protein
MINFAILLFVPWNLSLASGSEQVREVIRVLCGMGMEAEIQYVQ